MTNAKAMTEGDKETRNTPELPTAEAERQQKAQEAFERGIIERGEAAPRTRTASSRLA